MNRPLPPPPGLRDVSRDLAQADAEKLQRVVAMVDALAERGDADSLIAPLRPRLAHLRVRRPPSLTRLLFAPLDPVLVNAPRWQRGGPTVPRSVLGSFTALVRAGLGTEEAAAMERQLPGVPEHYQEVARAVGPALWSRAASLLADAPPPEDWSVRTGLAAADHALLTRATCFVLRHAPAIETVLQTPGSAPSFELLEPILTDPAATCASALATMLAVLLTRLPRLDAMLERLQASSAEANRATLRVASEKAFAFALGRLHGGSGLPPDLASAARELSRQAGMLDDLARWSEHCAPGKRAAIGEARRALDAACRKRFQASIEAHMVPPPEAAGGLADAAAVATLEHAARDLRRFAQAAQRIGGAAHYDQALQRAARSVTGPNAVTLTRADQARLMELLVDSEEAMRLWLGGAVTAPAQATAP